MIDLNNTTQDFPIYNHIVAVAATYNVAAVVTADVAGGVVIDEYAGVVAGFYNYLYFTLIQ